jgi:hypothetical protein
MVTKAQDVPWGEVEDLTEELRHWLVQNATSGESGAASTKAGGVPPSTSPLEIAGDSLWFAQILMGIQTPTTEEQSMRVRSRTQLIEQRTGGLTDVKAIAVIAECLRGLCAYDARGVRQLLRDDTKRMESNRARELLYEDSRVRDAEESIRRLGPALELVKKRIDRALMFERERHRAGPELRRELTPSFDPLAVPPAWPAWVENDAADLLRTIDTLQAGVEHLTYRFHAFFEPGRPPFPMTFAGWQELKRDIARRLEAVGWHLTPEGVRKSQSKST